MEHARLLRPARPCAWPPPRCGPSGFSQAMPTSSAPAARAATISSMFSMRAWLGPQIQMPSISGRCHHLLDGGEGLRVSHPQRAGQGRRFLGVRAVRAPDPPHVGVAHGQPGLHVETRDEAAAHETHAQPLGHSASSARILAMPSDRMRPLRRDLTVHRAYNRAPRARASSDASCARRRPAWCWSSCSWAACSRSSPASHVDRATGSPVNNFLNSYTLIQTATDASFFAIMAVGATIVIISGGIDLSVGSVYALAGVTMALCLRALGPGPALADRAPGPRDLPGRGARLRPPQRRHGGGPRRAPVHHHPRHHVDPARHRLRGQQGESILVPDALTAVAKASLGLASSLYPVPMLVMLAVTAVGARSTSTRTVMGRHVFAVGGNAEASRFAGPAPGPHHDRRLPGLGPDRRPGRLPGRQLLRLGLLRRRHRLRALRDRLGGGGRGQPHRRQGQRGQRHAGGAPHRPHPPVHPHPALRPELRVDHHRLRDHRGGGARSGQRRVAARRLARAAGA